LITVTLYTRSECHLCEQAKADLAALQSEIPHTLLEVDIEGDPALQKKYLAEIPVLEVGSYRLQAPFTMLDLRRILGAARDAQ
jgi:glutaredoxin